jgi:hypothetical protein
LYPEFGDVASVFVALWIAVKEIGQASAACSRMVPQKPQLYRDNQDAMSATIRMRLRG